MEIGLSLSLTSNKGVGWGPPALALTSASRPIGMTYRRNWTGTANHQPKKLASVQDSALVSAFDNATATIKAEGSTHCIIGHGNSLMQGMIVEGPLEKLIRRLARRGIAADYKNRGISGQGWNYDYSGGNQDPTLIVDAATEVFPLFANGKTNWLVAPPGSNDLALKGDAPATVITNATTYVDNAIAAGQPAARIVLATMVPRQAYSEVNRTTYNNGIIALAASRGCLLVPLHSDAFIGVAGQQNNTDWYYDTIHWTDQGSARAALLFEGVMFP